MSKKTVLETIVIILTAIISVAKVVCGDDNVLEINDENEENVDIL